MAREDVNLTLPYITQTIIFEGHWYDEPRCSHEIMPLQKKGIPFSVAQS